MLPDVEGLSLDGEIRTGRGKHQTVLQEESLGPMRSPPSIRFLRVLCRASEINGDLEATSER